MERVIEIGSHKFTQVVCKDEPGAGGACYEYVVVKTPPAGVGDCEVARVGFQNGPVKESGVNGCH